MLNKQKMTYMGKRSWAGIATRQIWIRPLKREEEGGQEAQPDQLYRHQDQVDQDEYHAVLPLLDAPQPPSGTPCSTLDFRKWCQAVTLYVASRHKIDWQVCVGTKMVFPSTSPDCPGPASTPYTFKLKMTGMSSKINSNRDRWLSCIRNWYCISRAQIPSVARMLQLTLQSLSEVFNKYGLRCQLVGQKERGCWVL